MSDRPAMITSPATNRANCSLESFKWMREPASSPINPNGARAAAVSSSRPAPLTHADRRRSGEVEHHHDGQHELHGPQVRQHRDSHQA